MDQYLRAPLLELRKAEVRRIYLPRTPVHKATSRSELLRSDLVNRYPARLLGQERADVDHAACARHRYDVDILNFLGVRVADVGEVPNRYEGAVHGVEAEIPARHHRLHVTFFQGAIV